jgi:hypothetical protein
MTSLRDVMLHNVDMCGVGRTSLKGSSMKNQGEVTPTEARQATMRPRAMVWVLFGSLFLCLMAGLGLALGWISLPLLR